MIRESLESVRVVLQIAYEIRALESRRIKKSRH